MATNTVRQLGSSPRDVKFSPDGTITYVSYGGTSIVAYSVATREYLGSYSSFFGSYINGFDVSADGRFLVVASAVATGEVSSGNTSARDISVFRQDLTTGQVTTYTTRVMNAASVFYDVEILNDGAVLLTGSATGAGTQPLTRLDLSTGVFTQVAGTATASAYPHILSSADGRVLLVTPDGALGQIATLAADGSPIATHNPVQDGITGTWTGAQAVSATANKLVFATSDGVHVYDTRLVYQGDILPRLRAAIAMGEVTAVTFSTDGTRLYASNPASQAVYEFATADWSLLRAYAIGAPLKNYGRDTLVVNGDILSVSGANSQYIIDLSTTNQIDGAAGADTLVGTADPDFIRGGAGNDRLEGSFGSDTLIGGAGDDVYVVGPFRAGSRFGGQPDVIVELPDEGNDRVVTSVDYAGRAAQGAEVTFWRNQLIGGSDYADVRRAILEDPAGRSHAATVIDGLYRDYAGRGAGAEEIAFWQGELRGGTDYAGVRRAILDDPLGQAYGRGEIAELYREYFGRDPASPELDVWQGLIRSGATYDTLAATLMSDGGSAGRVVQRIATAGADIFAYAPAAGHVAVTGFDPAADLIDLRGTAYAGRDPIAAGRATEVVRLDGSSDVLLAFSDGDTLLLHGVRLAQLGATDFLF